jgi:ribonuclease HI
VHRVACLPGSGGSLVAAAAGVADVLITGDLKYHQAQEAAGLGLALIEVPHEVAEEEALERWSEGFADVLASKGVEVEFQRREPGVWALSGESVAHERTHNHEDDHVHLYVDGGARGNPGPAGIGARLLTADGDLVEELADYIGEATNNVAEYQALVAGLQMALDHRVRRLTVFADSELVVKQLNGQYRVKDAVLRGFHDQASRLLHQIADVELRHIPREQNAEADRLVNQAIDGAAG